VCRSIGEAVNRMHGPDSKGRIGWLQAAGQRPSQDVTARFDELAKAAAAGDRTLPPDARDYTYLLVPGLMTERFPGYFDENQNRLRELGLNVSRVPLDTDASVETNARVVRDAILEAAKGGKKVVLLGHSKGGVDTAAALALYPELRPHVRSVVAMQAPYGGSPIAHDIQNCPELKGVADRLLQSAFQGDAKALSDLSYDRRREFLVRHPYPEDVPTVSLATSSSHPAAGTASAATYIRDRYGERSDGLVAAKDAEIPGSAVVRLENMDHAGAAMRGVRGVCSPYPPGDVTQALVTLALTTPGR
jgi:triacylglycerol esterase/lipase EstA (alpha/beta hydrolase family)